MRYWISYEENMRGVYTLTDLAWMYEHKVDRDEFPSFTDWMRDMERSAVFYPHECTRGPEDPDEYADWWDMDCDGEWSLYVFEDPDDEEPAWRGYVEDMNGYFEASFEADWMPYTEWKREYFKTLWQAQKWCASWAYFPKEG